MEKHKTRRLSSLALDEEDSSIRVSDNFSTQTSGFFHKYSFEQDKKATDIVEVLYNDRMRIFVLVDVRGITTWRPEAIDESVKRSLTYPKYVYRKFVSLIFARRYNVYFALSKDFCLEVLNRDFDSICTIDAEMRNTTFMVFDHARDELITGGMEGLKAKIVLSVRPTILKYVTNGDFTNYNQVHHALLIWKYGPSSKKVYGQIKPMSNYELTLKVDLSGRADVSSVKIAEVDSKMGYLYCCSDTDIICFSLLESGRLLCKFTGAHKGGICGCVYSPATQLLVTAAADAEIKLWNFSHGYTGMLTGHSRRITALRLIPEDTHLILTAAMDGSVRLWSLAVMECLYQVQVSSNEGIRWMGFGDPGQIFVASQRQVNVYTMSYLPEFWAHQRAQSLSLQLVGAEGKTTRLMSVCSDSSVRFFSRKSKEPLSTLLTPPCISPFSKLRGFSHSRTLGFSYLLVDARKLWVYLSRTNPASMVAEWNLAEVQANVNRSSHRRSRSVSATLLKEFASRRAVYQPIGKETRVVDVTSVTCLHSPVVMWTEEGDSCPPVLDFLLLGLDDGRVMFMDPVEKGKRHLELTVGKEEVTGLLEDRFHRCLITSSLAQDVVFVAIWSLPELCLEHEIAVPRDLTGLARLQDSLVTGHRSGQVLVHPLSPWEEAANPGVRPSISEAMLRRKPAHLAPVIAVDSCPVQDTFLSVSEEGATKIWNSAQVLLSEVTLDEPVSCAAFLNSTGDVILAMKSHLFLLSHAKYSSTDDDLASVSDVPESEIIEDPAIKYEGIVADPDPVDMDNYLCPFKAELSTKFTDPVHVEEEEELQEETESEVESVFSGADEALLSPYESVIDGSITEADETYLLRWTRVVHDHPRNYLAYEYEMPSIGQSPVSTPLQSLSPEATPVPSESEEELELRLEDIEEEEEEAEDRISGHVSPPSLPRQAEVEVKQEEKPKDDVAEIVTAKPKSPIVIKDIPKSAPPVAAIPPVQKRMTVADRLEAARIDPSDVPPPRQRPQLSQPPRKPVVPSTVAPQLETRSQPRRPPQERKKRPPKRRAAKPEKKVVRSRDGVSEKSGPAPTLTKVDIGEAAVSKASDGREKIRTIRKAPRVLAEVVESFSDHEEEEDDETEVEEEIKQAEEARRPRRFSAPRRRGRTPFLSTPSRTPDSTHLSVPDSGVAVSPEGASSVHEMTPPPASPVPPKLLSVSPDNRSRATTPLLPPQEPPGQRIRRFLSPSPVDRERGVKPEEEEKEAEKFQVGKITFKTADDTKDDVKIVGDATHDEKTTLKKQLSITITKTMKKESKKEVVREDIEAAAPIRVILKGKGQALRDSQRVFGADYSRMLELYGAKYLDSVYEHPYNLHRAVKDSVDTRPLIMTPEDSGAWGLESETGTEPSFRAVAPRVGISRRKMDPAPPPSAELGRPLSDIKNDEAMLEELQWALHLPRQVLSLLDDEADPETLQIEQEQFQKLNQFYEKLLQRFQSSRPNTPLDKIFHNDGVHALAPDQQIERHILLRLRRQLRQHSAAEKRRAMTMEQEERRRALSGHRYCAQDSPPTRLSLLPSAPDDGIDSIVRPATCGAETERKQTPFHRPATSGADKEKKERKATPYRFTKGADIHGENLYDLKPRNEIRLHLRAKYSAPSIPSKCRRYALVSSRSKEIESSPPSLTEERLIRDRFPQFRDQWVGDYALLEPKPWMLALRHSANS